MQQRRNLSWLMAYLVSVSNAESLLRQAVVKKVGRLRRHLLVAAAIREVLAKEPIVVGGTAEEYWAAAEYHETDMDLCAPLTRADLRALESLGFVREGRHFWHEQAEVAVEFPDSQIDGDINRVKREDVGLGVATIIGLDDLYVDRLKQATVTDETTGIEFQSALAVAAARYEEIDWDYIRRRIQLLEKEQPNLVESMRKQNSRIRRHARKSLTADSS